jgi:hypothetical protein
VNVYSIHQWAGQSIPILLNLRRRAPALSAQCPHGHGFIAATNINSDEKVSDPAAREIVTFPSQSADA